jgi:hypothetical protein
MGILTIGVPDVEHAQELAGALEDRWACCASDSPDQPMTVVFLSPHNASDFAQLVRRVQAWLTERSLGAIAFELRGRGHIHSSSAS